MGGDQRRFPQIIQLNADRAARHARTSQHRVGRIRAQRTQTLGIRQRLDMVHELQVRCKHRQRQRTRQATNDAVDHSQRQLLTEIVDVDLVL